MWGWNTHGGTSESLHGRWIGAWRRRGATLIKRPPASNDEGRNESVHSLPGEKSGSTARIRSVPSPSAQSRGEVVPFGEDGNSVDLAKSMFGLVVSCRRDCKMKEECHTFPVTL